MAVVNLEPDSFHGDGREAQLSHRVHRPMNDPSRFIQETEATRGGRQRRDHGGPDHAAPAAADPGSSHGSVTLTVLLPPHTLNDPASLEWPLAWARRGRAGRLPVAVRLQSRSPS